MPTPGLKLLELVAGNKENGIKHSPRISAAWVLSIDSYSLGAAGRWVLRTYSWCLRQHLPDRRTRNGRADKISPLARDDSAPIHWVSQ
ncbi:hypothetical protein SNE35_03720 [Paucibacter sp. R3-3]|uniref:Winged helix-turn helix domain-containing protein n=1 Tax=Roseateles agri TaxID=3098619 RepID=A0ABU5DCW5_9BURK|nr:hypothetical protein [Paucibacter sp. R3-3]MDY0743595.1 hypothetical protein [Paucibacter sp. R3-3]